MARTHRYKKNDILNAVRGSNGLVTNVARKLDCDWHTARDNILRFPDVVKLFESESEEMLDFAEYKVHKAITAADMVTVRWYLATKGRNRGYGETAPQPADENEDTEIKIEIVDGENDD